MLGGPLQGGVVDRVPPSFPEITITTTYGPLHFAHDVGDVQDSKSVYKVGDFTADSPAPLLPHVIKLRKGWVKDGKNDEKTTKEVAKAFLTEVMHVTIPKIDQGWTPEQYKRHTTPEVITIRSSKAEQKKIPSPTKPAEPHFHQPTESIEEIDGNKYVQIAYWTSKREGKGPWRGPPFVMAWTEHYHLFDVTDGTVYSGCLHLFEIPA